MPSSWRAFTLGCLSLLVGASAMSAPQSASLWQARQERALRMSQSIMHEADRQQGLLARYDVMYDAYRSHADPSFHRIFDQYLSWYLTFIGDYPAASAMFSIKQTLLPGDRASPLSTPGESARPALEAIPGLARNYRAVFFNEAHNVPLTRTLTVQLLGKLRAEGFGYFAAETLSRADTGLQARGYPVAQSGFYTEEPISAEMVRTALKLGFKVIAYEAGPDAVGDERETEQARNLCRQVFQNDPHARLVVDAGYAHILESGKFLGGSSMAEHLHRLCGIDPLTVEQTTMFPHQSAGDNHPYYVAVMQKLRPTVPIVFENKANAPWSLRAGYDVSVFFPPQVLRHGRPTWLALGGLRKPRYIGGDHCLDRYPCLIEARYADEGADAIPADRLVLAPMAVGNFPGYSVPFVRNTPSGDLYLRPGKYRLTYQDDNGHRWGRREITVR